MAPIVLNNLRTNSRAGSYCPIALPSGLESIGNPNVQHGSAEGKERSACRRLPGLLHSAPFAIFGSSGHSHHHIIAALAAGIVPFSLHEPLRAQDCISRQRAPPPETL